VEERAILALERGRSAAIARSDTVWLANLYASDFRGIAGNGSRIVRTDLFRIFGRDDPVSRFLIDELAAHSYGAVATVTGRLRTLAATGEVTAESRYLHVYVTREGRWQLVAAQATVVPKPAKG
jgi:ketosteroid isomerase-like protein